MTCSHCRKFIRFHYNGLCWACYYSLRKLYARPVYARRPDRKFVGPGRTE